jgi:hypothetical protein
MTANDVLSIINRQLEEASSGEKNLHGITPADILSEPYEEAYLSFEGSQVFQYWTVLEEMEDRSGYTIYFDPDQEKFGLGCRTKEGVVDVGTHGTFLEALRGM